MFSLSSTEERKNEVPFSMEIGSGELKHEHLRSGVSMFHTAAFHTQGKKWGVSMERRKADTKKEVPTAYHFTYSKYNINKHNVVLFYKIRKKNNEIGQ